jgi:hypothetical protein
VRERGSEGAMMFLKSKLSCCRILCFIIQFCFLILWLLAALALARWDVINWTDLLKGGGRVHGGR